MGHVICFSLAPKSSLYVSCRNILPVSTFFQEIYCFVIFFLFLFFFFNRKPLIYIQKSSNKAIKTWTLLSGTKPSASVIILFCRKAAFKWTFKICYSLSRTLPSKVKKISLASCSEDSEEAICLMNPLWLTSGTSSEISESRALRFSSALQEWAQWSGVDLC